MICNNYYGLLQSIYHDNFFILVITSEFRYFYINLTVCCKISSGTWRSLSYCAFSLYPDTVQSEGVKIAEKCGECFVRFITCYVYHQLVRLLQVFEFVLDYMWEKWASSCTLSCPRDLSVACTNGRDNWSWWFPRQFWNTDKEGDSCSCLRLHYSQYRLPFRSMEIHTRSILLHRMLLHLTFIFSIVRKRFSILNFS